MIANLADLSAMQLMTAGVSLAVVVLSLGTLLFTLLSR